MVRPGEPLALAGGVHRLRRWTTATSRGSSTGTWSTIACCRTSTRSPSTPTASTRTASRPAPRTTWTSRRCRRSRRSRGGSASTRSSSTTAGRRAPATGSPTRREYPGAALGRHARTRSSGRASPMRSSSAVRDAIAPMKLGLWMSPTFFNPSSETFAQHPEWVCHPVGDGLAASNLADPDSGSNEAGLGAWGPAALPHVEGRIRDAIENWGVALLQVRLPGVARLPRRPRRRARPVRVPRRVRRDARPAARRPPGGHVPDRRDERLPAVPVRVGHARAVVVPERRARTSRTCCTTCGT